MEIVSKNRMYDGLQLVCRHRSNCCDCDMQFAVFIPARLIAADNTIDTSGGKLPALFWLSGLTCTEQNFITKSAAQRTASELGVILVAPDTSPRGEGVPDDESGAYDFGLGAGFYLNALQSPWQQHYQMYSYIVEELTAEVLAEFPVDAERLGISGHSMGGHGALTIHLKNPDLFKSVSAFSPIVAPSQVPWGIKALGNYLGEDKAGWSQYDATLLVAQRPSNAVILVDQGSADEFLEEQLKPQLFADACAAAGQELKLNLREGYDHSYYFIASFIDSHIRHHANALNS